MRDESLIVQVYSFGSSLIPHPSSLFSLARRSQNYIHSFWRRGRARANVAALAALSCCDTLLFEGLYAKMMQTDFVESSLARVRLDAEAERELTRLTSGFVST